MTRTRIQKMTVKTVERQLVDARVELERIDRERGYLNQIIRGFEAWFRLSGRSMYEIVSYGYWDATAASVIEEMARIRALPAASSKKVAR